MRRAVFLDRDGVLNAPVIREGKPSPPDSLAALKLLPGVNEVLSRLRAAGCLKRAHFSFQNDTFTAI